MNTAQKYTRRNWHIQTGTFWMHSESSIHPIEEDISLFISSLYCKNKVPSINQTLAEKRLPNFSTKQFD